MTLRKSFTAILLVLVLVLSFVAPMTMTKTKAAEGDTIPPAAAVLPEVLMTCSAGQVDINHAGIDALGQAWDLDVPIAQRIIDYRPYLQVKDLSVVEGIGPDRLALILDSDLGCATPISSPPPALEVCADPGLVDLQSASLSELSQGLGLPQRTAERLIAARPFAQMNHVVPERVPGVGKGTLDRVIAKSCLTPMPVRTATTSWRWAYKTLETSVVRDGYQLTVPAGVIDETSGAWLEITPLEIPEDRPGPAYPTADFHVHGQWEGLGDTVRVTVPPADFADDFPADQWRPYLLHWDDQTRSTGEAVLGDAITVDPDTGSVSADLSHLSFLDWGMHGLNWLIEPVVGTLFGNRYPAPSCGETEWPQIAGQPVWTNGGASATLLGGLIDLPGNIAPLGGYIIKHCVQTGDTSNEWGSSVRVLLRNNTGTIQRLSESADPNSHVDIKGDGISPDLFAWALVSVDKGGDEFLAPGSTGHMQVPAGEFGLIDMKPDVARSLMYIALEKAFSQSLVSLAKQVPALDQAIIEIGKCVYEQTINIFSSLTQNPDVNIARSTASALYKCTDYDLIYKIVTGALEDGGVIGNADAAFASLKKVREAVKYLQVGEVAINVLDTSVWGTFDPALIRVEHQAAKPTNSLDSAGRVVLDRCLSPNPAAPLQWQIDMGCQNAAYSKVEQPTGGGGDTGLPPGKIVQTIDHRSFLYETDDKVLRHIPDGNTYICLARHYAVDFEVRNDLEPYISLAGAGPYVAADATCDDALPPTRVITPEALSSFTVLREPDGTAWVTMGGQRLPINSAGEFSCWVNPQYEANIEFDGWDYVTPEELSRFPQGTGSVSNCGDPRNPQY